MLFESRKSPRLPNYDYSQKGKYFITFCNIFILDKRLFLIISEFVLIFIKNTLNLLKYYTKFSKEVKFFTPNIVKIWYYIK